MQPQEDVTLRRSTQERKPVILNEYVINALQHESDLSIDNDLVYFHQAIQSDNSDKWLVSMQEDMKSMADNNVWEWRNYQRILKELAVNGSLRPREKI